MWMGSMVLCLQRTMLLFLYDIVYFTFKIILRAESVWDIEEVGNTLAV